MLDKRSIKRIARRIGFNIEGDFLIGSRSEDVISGLAIDAAPYQTYIWTFILPTFDKLPFLHMSLGEREVINELAVDEVYNKMLNIWKKISHISSAEDIIYYVDINRLNSDYSNWARLICLIRLGFFDRAEKILSDVDINSMSHSNLEKIRELMNAKSYGGWGSVQSILSDWSKYTNKILENIPIGRIHP